MPSSAIMRIVHVGPLFASPSSYILHPFRGKMVFFSHRLLQPCGKALTSRGTFVTSCYLRWDPIKSSKDLVGEFQRNETIEKPCVCFSSISSRSNRRERKAREQRDIESERREKGGKREKWRVFFSFSPFLGSPPPPRPGDDPYASGFYHCNMWSFASNALAGSIGPKNSSTISSRVASECSDDEVSSSTSREEGLECPICWESFNIVENVPYVLWCGHTLCKNCVLGLQWAVVKFPTLPVQLPLFISCPWCHLLSFRLIYKGNLKFPRKNFFLLWMVESMNGDRVQSHTRFCEDNQASWSSNGNVALVSQSSHHHHHLRRTSYMIPEESLERNQVGSVGYYLNFGRLHSSLRKSLVFFVHLTAKFPLVIILLLIVLYAIPASAAILALYIIVTVLFALPSFLILYFAYPSLDWLVREIIT